MRRTLVFFKDWKRWAHRKVLKLKSPRPGSLPFSQALRAREEHVSNVARKFNLPVGDTSVRNTIEQKLYGSNSKRLTRAPRREKRIFSMQGLGDNESLASSLFFDEDASSVDRYGGQDLGGGIDDTPPPPYTPLMARKLARGQFWPSVGPLYEAKEFTRLKNENTMTRSAAQLSAQVEYHLRRSLKACPQHIAEKIDFSQVMIDRVYASRRSLNVYIVWSTVDPSARYVIEPLLRKINYWVIRLILRRIKVTPNIPKITWVYNSGMMAEEIPRKLMNELRDAEATANEDMDERVKFLKKADELTHRMKGIPWFMPYLWAKEQRAEKKKVMESDLAKFQESQAKRGSKDAKLDVPFEPRYVR